TIVLFRSAPVSPGQCPKSVREHGVTRGDMGEVAEPRSTGILPSCVVVAPSVPGRNFHGIQEVGGSIPLGYTLLPLKFQHLSVHPTQPRTFPQALICALSAGSLREGQDSARLGEGAPAFRHPAQVVEGDDVVPLAHARRLVTRERRIAPRSSGLRPSATARSPSRRRARSA